MCGENNKYNAKQIATCVRKYWLAIVGPAVILGLLVYLLDSSLKWSTLPSDSYMSFVVSMTGIMLTLVLVPLCLKMHVFHFMKRRFQNEDVKVAYKAYMNMSLLRIILLCSTAVVNFIPYVLYDNQSNGICILITGIALAFCWTSEDKVKDEMQRDDKAIKTTDGIDSDKRQA